MFKLLWYEAGVVWSEECLSLFTQFSEGKKVKEFSIMLIQNNKTKIGRALKPVNELLSRQVTL